MDLTARATLHVHADLSGLPSRWFRTQPPAATGHPRLAEVRLGGIACAICGFCLTCGFPKNNHETGRCITWLELLV